MRQCKTTLASFRRNIIPSEVYQNSSLALTLWNFKDSVKRSQCREISLDNDKTLNLDSTRFKVLERIRKKILCLQLVEGYKSMIMYIYAHPDKLEMSVLDSILTGRVSL